MCFVEQTKLQRNSSSVKREQLNFVNRELNSTLFHYEAIVTLYHDLPPALM